MDEPFGRRFGLSPITLAEKPRFDSAYAALKQPISDYSFANTFVWGTSLELYWRRIAGHLCVFANGTGDLTMLLPPIPEASDAQASLGSCLAQCFEIMDAYNSRQGEPERSRIEYVSDEMLERVSASRGVTLSATPMSSDYVYSTERMIDLAGGALKSKRHARSKFMRNHPDHCTERLDPAHVPACLDLLERWCRHGDVSHDGEVNDSHLGSDILRHRETLACQKALRNFTQLGLSGMVLCVGSKVVGFTLGEALSPTQASILIEKTDPEYDGAAQFIFSEFCRQYWSQFPECNVSDDWGIPSLRFTKQSYRPVRLLSKYTLTRQPVPVVAGFSPIDVPTENPIHQVESAAMAAAPAAVSAGTDHQVEAPVPQLRLRAARVDDVPGILALEQVCFENVAETFNKRQIRSLIRNQRAVVTVAQLGEQIAGWCVGLLRQHRTGRSGRVYAVAVHPQVRGRRLGQQLVEHIRQQLASHHIRRVYLEVRQGNDPAIALYHKLGFVVHKQLPNYYGSGVDGLRMRWLCPSTPPAETAAATSDVLAGSTSTPAPPAELRGEGDAPKCSADLAEIVLEQLVLGRRRER